MYIYMCIYIYIYIYMSFKYIYLSKQLAQCEQTITESVFWMRITDGSFKLKKQ